MLKRNDIMANVGCPDGCQVRVLEGMEGWLSTVKDPSGQMPHISRNTLACARPSHVTGTIQIGKSDLTVSSLALLSTTVDHCLADRRVRSPLRGPINGNHVSAVIRLVPETAKSAHGATRSLTYGRKIQTVNRAA